MEDQREKLLDKHNKENPNQYLFKGEKYGCKNPLINVPMHRGTAF
jgi:hypothetical protein